MKPAAFDMLLTFLATAVLLAAACFVTGPTLGLFLGGIIFSAILAPSVALVHPDWSSRLLSVGGVCDGVALVWLIAVIGGHISLLGWLTCYTLLIAWTFAVAGIGWAAHSLRLNAILSTALAIFAALSWLAAPIWMSPNCSAAAMQRMAGIHPLLAINGIVAHLGIWTEQPVMYRLSRLGQDVAYQFPQAWIVAGIYAIIAIALIAVSMALRRNDEPCDPQTRSTPPPAPTL